MNAQAPLAPSATAVADTPYSDEFYVGQMEGSYRSARIYVQHLSRRFRPATVADVGCGRGTWLKAWLEAGATRAVGLDGPWNRADNMVDPRIEFQACDLSQPFSAGATGRYDLAMSLEVAEHLEPAAAKGFVQSLTALSDVVVFGAAFTGQGGTSHLNEQMPSWWAGLFGACGWRPFDAFRPSLWGEREVEVWYRQNTFLYAREGSARYDDLIATGLRPMEHLGFMDCMHPDLFQDKLQPTLKRGLRMVVDSGKRRWKAL